MRDRRGACRVLVGHLMERDLMEDLDVDGRLILKWIFKTWDGGGMSWIDVTE
jgi:hypothetical protein